MEVLGTVLLVRGQNSWGVAGTVGYLGAVGGAGGVRAQRHGMVTAWGPWGQPGIRVSQHLVSMRQ